MDITLSFIRLRDKQVLDMSADVVLIRDCIAA